MNSCSIKMSSVHCCELHFFSCCTSLKNVENLLILFDYYCLVLCLSYFPHLLFYIFVFVFILWLFLCEALGVISLLESTLGCISCMKGAIQIKFIIIIIIIIIQ